MDEIAATSPNRSPGKISCSSSARTDETACPVRLRTRGWPRNSRHSNDGGLRISWGSECKMRLHPDAGTPSRGEKTCLPSRGQHEERRNPGNHQGLAAMQTTGQRHLPAPTDDVQRGQNPACARASRIPSQRVSPGPCPVSILRTKESNARLPIRLGIVPDLKCLDRRGLAQ